MAILELITFPNQVLRERTQTVTEFNKELKKFTDDMFETMYDAPGVGLAANQVGVSKRIAVIDVDYDIEGEDEASRKIIHPNPRVMINLEILSRTGDLIFKEGCLSVPGFHENVKRYSKVKARYQNLKGESEEIDAEGLLAVAIQHEVDHLEGKLFIDRLSQIKKSLIKGKIFKRGGREGEKSRFKVEL